MDSRCSGVSKIISSMAATVWARVNGGPIIVGAVRQSLSRTMASISTAMLPGRDPMPTALRAARPFSPQMSTIRLLNPLMTAG